MATNSNNYKPVQSSIFSNNTTRAIKTLDGVDLSYTKCSRNPADVTADGWKANYFMSLNLPYVLSELPSGDTSTSYVAAHNPELYQLNVDEIVICPIPESYYSELIDGRTLVMSVPQASGATLSAKTVVSSFYTNNDNYTNSNILLGQNVAFLFSNDINLPFTGTTGNGTILHSGNTTWESSTYLTRPPAVKYSQLLIDDYGTDGRLWSDVNLALDTPNGYPSVNNVQTGYNYDMPVGFINLDKGIIVYTHPDIVNNIPFSAGTQMHFDSDGAGVIDGVAGTSEDFICFTGTSTSTSGTTGSTANFTDISINYKMNVVCLALPGEFFMSTNKTWNYSGNYTIWQNQQTDYDSIYVTEIGLFNQFNDLIAIAKFDRPIEKSYTNIINFNLEINM